MRNSDDGIRRFATGAGGTLLLVSLFLPWVDVGGIDSSGWELWTLADLFFALAAVCALSTALAGGRIGVFRADVSLIGLTDMLNVTATLLIVWFLAFDLPAGAGIKVGSYVALIGAIVAASGAGEYKKPAGGWFPRLGSGS